MQNLVDWQSKSPPRCAGNRRALAMAQGLDVSAATFFPHLCLHLLREHKLLAGQQRVDLAVCIVADRMDPFSKKFVRCVRIAVDQRLDRVMMPLQQHVDFGTLVL